MIPTTQTGDTASHCKPRASGDDPAKTAAEEFGVS